MVFEFSLKQFPVNLTVLQLGSDTASIPGADKYRNIVWTVTSEKKCTQYSEKNRNLSLEENSFYVYGLCGKRFSAIV